MAWIDRHPDDLIERSEPSQALGWLRQPGTRLDEPALGKLDLFMHHWVLVLLQRPADAQGVLELINLCQVARVRASASAEAPSAQAMGQRWQAFEDLLEGKRLALRAADEAAATPAAPLRQEAAIQQYIAAQAGGQATQAALAQHLGLSAGRVSQILGVLEGRGQVTRQRRGQENWVRWVPAQGSVARATSREEAASAPSASDIDSDKARHLGAQIFGWPAARTAA